MGVCGDFRMELLDSPGDGLPVSAVRRELLTTFFGSQAIRSNFRISGRVFLEYGIVWIPLESKQTEGFFLPASFCCIWIVVCGDVS